MRRLVRRTRALLGFWKPWWEHTRISALRWLLRRAPSERQRVFALTILAGVLCGLAAVGFHLAIRAAEGLLIDRALGAPGSAWMFWRLLLPTLGGVVSGALLYYVVPDARSSLIRARQQ